MEETTTESALIKPLENSKYNLEVIKKINEIIHTVNTLHNLKHYPPLKERAEINLIHLIFYTSIALFMIIFVYS